MMIVGLDVAAALVLSGLAITDWRGHRLPRGLMALFLVLVFLRAAGQGGLAGALLAAGSGLAAAAPLWGLRRLAPAGDPRWRLGGGDVRLAFALGAWLGMVPALLVLTGGAAAAGLVGLATASFLRRATTQPLGSWCALVLAGAWLAGQAP